MQRKSYFQKCINFRISNSLSTTWFHQQHQVDVINVDFSKAFEKIQLHLLVEELLDYNIQGEQFHMSGVDKPVLALNESLSCSTLCTLLSNCVPTEVFHKHLLFSYNKFTTCLVFKSNYLFDNKFAIFNQIFPNSKTILL